MKSKLLLFTGSFPYPKYRETTFLETEVIYLSEKFHLIIIPSDISGAPLKLDDKIQIDRTYAKIINELNSKSILLKTCLLITKKWFLKELIIQFKKTLKNPKKIKAIIYDGYLAHLTNQWVKEKYNENECFLYTYWFNAITFGLSIKRNAQKLITRAHNVDLYEERNTFIPFRLQTISSIDYIILISENGRNYLIKKFPKYISKYQVFRLGTVNKFHSPLKLKNNEEVFRIVSCSSITEVKRVLLIPHILNIVSQKLPELKIEWIHIGDGILAKELYRLINIYKSERLIIKSLGYLSSTEIYEFYNKTFVDIFLNISSYEGIPMTIMEAQSFGIPVIATDVGGNSEIVNNNVGLLIDSDIDIYKTAERIEIFIKKNKNQIELRQNSLDNWNSNFNSNKNSAAFVDFISKII